LFHHQTQISSAAPSKSKTSNTNNLQANKNNQKHKRTTQIRLLASTTFHDAQPSHSLAPSTSHPSHFRVFIFHPFTSTYKIKILNFKKKLDIISTSQIIHLIVKGLIGIQDLWQMDEKCFYGQREFK
jgi:hypothetical protein